LPESQLDRFLMCIHLGYPDRLAERDLLRSMGRRHLLADLPALLDEPGLRALQDEVRQINVSDAVLDYVQDLVEGTRNGRWFEQGLSPRAAQNLVHAARACALVEGRSYVVPDDVAAMWEPVCAHRLVASGPASPSVADALRRMLEQTPLR